MTSGFLQLESTIDIALTTTSHQQPKVTPVIRFKGCMTRC
jgi:hypothetical protein